MVLQQAPRTTDKSNIYGFDLGQLTELVASYEVPGFHAAQIFGWMYGKRELSVAGWTDLPGGLRERLAADVSVDPGRIVSRVEAADGTLKYRTGLAGGVGVESVYMTQNDRVTLCLSSQVGCALGCDFCLTARMGLVRHLTPGEIVGQVALIQRDRRLDEQSFNLVYMGMGEPLHNYDAVMASIRLLTAPRGFGISRRRITVSTSGLAPAIERLAREPVRPRLAVSLNATTDALRSQLMPINRKYPIERLIQACREFARASGERMTLEYVLLGGVNDSERDAARLTEIVRRLPAKLNLIPFNEVPGRLPFTTPARARVLQFRRRLLDQGVPVSIRWSRGADAQAACGQLAALPTSTKTPRAEGGSRGIGRACCELLSRAGARVAVNYQLERPHAELLVRRIEEAGGTAFALAADVTRADEAEMLVDETASRYGGLDIVVNNAGIWRGSPIDELSDGEWAEMIGVNLTGTFHVIRAAVPHLKQGGGRIINISSTAGQRGEALHSHYAATKGGIISLTKSLGAELASCGITVNCVAPGWVETDMTRESLAGEQGDAIVAGIPLGRAGRPEEVAGAVLFLASDLATFVTGEILNVNGGAVMCG